jgi:hypothetical protein
MANTTNFGWETPDDTDLVKDGALAMRTLGNAIDASLVDLKGGTTGQVLSKTSNTDMDFTWVTSDDANAIQNAIVDAKGDLITATAADTPARLAVGLNGDTLVADSAATTGLRWQGNFAAGKNAVINGDFRIWQRGTSFTPTATNTFTADRWTTFYDGTGATRTISQQAFTLGSAPVAGYEAPFFLRYDVSVAGSGNTFNLLRQPIEDVRTFAGQTVTYSFWAKASSSISVTPRISQLFGSGGSATVDNNGSAFTIGTTWARYTATFSVASISGKTIGTGSALAFDIRLPSNTTFTFDVWGCQLEAGSVATAFQTATGTLQGELAAGMRYYEKSYDQATALGTATNNGANSGTRASGGWATPIRFAVTKRTAPTVTVYSTATGTSARIRNRDAGTDEVASASDIGQTGLPNVSGTGGTSGVLYTWHWEASAEL